MSTENPKADRTAELVFELQARLLTSEYKVHLVHNFRMKLIDLLRGAYLIGRASVKPTTLVGPTGPTGPAGPMGPPGPSRAAKANQKRVPWGKQ